MLQASPPPARTHDPVMLDLDGVVYVGGAAVAGAPDHLAAARGLGARLAFVTNNASRTPDTVAERLSGLGVPAEPADVVTSAQAAARLAAGEHGDGAPVAVLGGAGLHEAAAAQGLTVVGLDDDPVGLLTGYGPDVRWSEVMRAAVAVADGLPWVASNTDHTIPTPHGPAPGHGVLVDTVARFTGVAPRVAGKPEPPLLTETVRRVGGDRPLMVGDRLDTDIRGGRRIDAATMLVLTGVTGLTELAAAPSEDRPTMIWPDLGGLLVEHTVPEREGPSGWRQGGWVARVREGRLELDGEGPASAWWQAAACACWQHLDAAGTPADVRGVVAGGATRAG